MTEITFSGTRQGMTIAQWERFNEILEIIVRNSSTLVKFHDGDCIGADQQAHATAHRLKSDTTLRNVELHGHPCNLDDQRAWMDYDVIYPVKTPIVRNKEMVDVSGYVLATPFQYEEVIRGSGTWATMRYAVKTETSLTVIWPDGTAIDGAELKFKGRT